MKQLVNSASMKKLDWNTIHQMGVPSLVLMERASLGVVEELEKNFDLKHILVVCGSGNNGGDGLALARILHLRGYDTRIYMAGRETSFTEETKIQWEICKNYKVPVVNICNPDEYTTIVDAVFGIGLSRQVGGSYKELFDKINASLTPVMAVDVPSGIDGTTGQVWKTAVKAEMTVTFAYGKKGLFLLPGADYAGNVVIKDIGIYGEAEDSIRLLEEDILQKLPDRGSGGNKGTFGKVLVAAGSRNMSGAAYFAARAALMTGAGMVKVFTEECNRIILSQLLPEALITTYEPGEDEEELVRKLKNDMEWADSAVCGPGLGQSDTAWTIVCSMIRGMKEKPLAADADALNLISRRPEILNECGSHLVLTPHMGEMARLTGKPVDDLKADPEKIVRAFIKKYPVDLIMKDAVTLIGTKEGIVYLYKGRNPGMATAGSGDVLAGITAGLLAALKNPEYASCLAVYLHGRAGEAAKRTKGGRSMTASDIIDGISQVLLNL